MVCLAPAISGRRVTAWLPGNSRGAHLKSQAIWAAGSGDCGLIWQCWIRASDAHLEKRRWTETLCERSVASQPGP